MESAYANLQTEVFGDLLRASSKMAKVIVVWAARISLSRRGGPRILSKMLSGLYTHTVPGYFPSTIYLSLSSFSFKILGRSKHYLKLESLFILGRE